VPSCACCPTYLVPSPPSPNGNCITLTESHLFPFASLSSPFDLSNHQHLVPPAASQHLVVLSSFTNIFLRDNIISSLQSISSVGQSTYILSVVIAHSLTVLYLTSRRLSPTPISTVFENSCSCLGKSYSPSLISLVFQSLEDHSPCQRGRECTPEILPAGRSLF